ncbi:hypothetical protein ACOSP7_029494 [Xanthoceras sorbifolium]|uniref:Cyclin-dependent protein kinase inhibitor SMR3-like n=1 Tax=Xanthoceras sorbifolium TaxID=99658 RepID=A0ABQ8HB43_9ROSI|nr:hypothetical protein JRO89_XS12G0043200 [Xanthoceras sorbifolium]
MYSELFDRVVLVPNKSNSEVFLIKGDRKGVEFDTLKRPQMPEFQGESRVSTAAAASSHDPELITRRESPEVLLEDDDDHEKKKKKEDDYEDTQVGSEKPNDKRLGLGELNATTSDHNDDEGFKTPTSLDHKIPEIKQCPPAPRKPMPLPPRKRKSSVSSSPNVRRSLQYSDLSQEVESLFPRRILDDLHRKIKKARTLEEEDKENQ